MLTDPVLFAQSTFRALMDAVARPGTVQAVAGVASAPAPLLPSTAAVALALCDQDTPVWLDAPFAAEPEVAQWLRFHTGAPLTHVPSDAAFALIADPAAVLPFDAFHPGTPDYPDRSTTLVLQVRSLDSGAALTLSGPGIRGRSRLQASTLPADIRERLSENRALFPCGVDLLLVAENAVAALPRSVRLVAEGH